MNAAARPWEWPPAGALAARAAALAAIVPVIETQRLRLRAPRISDWSAYRAIVLSPRWAAGPGETEEDAWLDFAQMVAGWMQRGTGLHAIERRDDGALIGFVPLNHEYGDPEMELGWFVTGAAEGNGYATEAARAVRDHAASEDLTGLVSYIATNNARSLAVARRLSAVRDEAADVGIDCEAWRHPRAAS